MLFIEIHSGPHVYVPEQRPLHMEIEQAVSANHFQMTDGVQ
jgi:hypothetical protein